MGNVSNVANGASLESELRNGRLTGSKRTIPIEMPDSDVSGVDYIPIPKRIIVPLLPARLNSDGDGLVIYRKRSCCFEGGYD